MYGLINEAIRDLVISRHGDATWRRVLALADLEDDAFVRMCPYDDAVTFQLVDACVAELDSTTEDILRAFGHYWTLFTAEQGYGSLLDSAGSSFAEFLHNLDALHSRVGEIYPELRPPSFDCRELDNLSLELTYRSERVGLDALVEGLLLGLGDRFGLRVEIDQTSRKGESADHSTFHIRLLAQPPADARALGEGTLVGSYRILGAMAASHDGARAYLAGHAHLPRKAIVRICDEQCGPTADHMLRQAKLLSRLNHARVPTLYEAGLHEGRPYLIVEQIMGWNLEQRLHERREPMGSTLALNLALRIGREIAMILHHVHDAGLVHHDIRSANVLLGANGEIRLVGFFAAHALRRASQSFDNLFFLNPDEPTHSVENPAVDLRGLGSILHEILTGDSLLVDPDDARPEALAQALASLAELVPANVVEIVRRCFDPAVHEQSEPALSIARSLDLAMAQLQRMVDTLTEPKAGDTLLMNAEQHGGDILGSACEYSIGASLGEGAYGKVYRATELLSGREVALKLLKQQWIRDTAQVRRFYREATILARLSHPNVIQIYNFGRWGDTLFIATEFLRGHSLETILDDDPAPFPITRALTLIAELLEGLAFVHANGVIHHDIKPANVFCCPDRTILMDFGIALTEDLDRLTRTGTILGTPSYMAPEQLEGQRGDSNTDTYSAGVLLYEMLTRRRPHEATSLSTLQLKILTAQPTPIRSLRPELPEDLVELVHSMLVKQPEHRVPIAVAHEKLVSILGSMRQEGPRR